MMKQYQIAILAYSLLDFHKFKLDNHLGRILFSRNDVKMYYVKVQKNNHQTSIDCIRGLRFDVLLLCKPFSSNYNDLHETLYSMHSSYDIPVYSYIEKEWKTLNMFEILRFRNYNPVDEWKTAPNTSFIRTVIKDELSKQSFEKEKELLMAATFLKEEVKKIANNNPYFNPVHEVEDKKNSTDILDSFDFLMESKHPTLIEDAIRNKINAPYKTYEVKKVDDLDDFFQLLISLKKQMTYPYLKERVLVSTDFYKEIHANMPATNENYFDNVFLIYDVEVVASNLTNGYSVLIIKEHIRELDRKVFKCTWLEEKSPIPVKWVEDRRRFVSFDMASGMSIANDSIITNDMGGKFIDAAVSDFKNVLIMQHFLFQKGIMNPLSRRFLIGKHGRKRYNEIIRRAKK